MQRIVSEEDVSFRCHLAFLSVGSAISETVTDCAPEIRQQMELYCARHSGAFTDIDYGAEHLRTIFALQDTVTRDRHATSENRGGTGFSDIICLFWDLAGGEGDAKLSIVSGRTCLHIDNRHRDVVFPADDEPFNYWFNETNSIALPPAPDMIEELDTPFQEALITMGFTQDLGYLERTVDAYR